MNGISREKVVHVTVGENVTATPHGEEFNLTADKEYKVLGFDGDCIQIENDLGVKDWYSLDYFREFYEM